MTLLLDRSSTERLVDLTATIEAVEAAFVAHGRGAALDPARVHVGAPGGGFHIVVGGLHDRDTCAFAAKINASFEPGPGMGGLKLVGLIVLSDARDGTPLAVMDSRAVTGARTAALTGVALRHLARQESTTLVVAGAGRQAAAQIAAAKMVLPALAEVLVWSPTPQRREALASQVHSDSLRATAVADLAGAVEHADAVVTVTPSHAALFPAEAVRRGTTIVALGSDGPGKQELDPALLARTDTLVVPDVTAQCVASGELGHAVRAGLMSPEDVGGQLGEVLAGLAPGRLDDDQIVVVDSTGTAMQDVAGAWSVYRRALDAGLGTEFSFDD